MNTLSKLAGKVRAKIRVLDFVGAAYLAKEDLSEPVVVTIADVLEQSFENKPRPKLVMRFAELKKAFVLNNTNILALVELLGSDDPDEWIGQKVTLYVDPAVAFAGRAVGGIRVAGPTGELPRTAAPALVPTAERPVNGLS